MRWRCRHGWNMRTEEARVGKGVLQAINCYGQGCNSVLCPARKKLRSRFSCIDIDIVDSVVVVITVYSIRL